MRLLYSSAWVWLRTHFWTFFPSEFPEAERTNPQLELVLRNKSGIKYNYTNCGISAPNAEHPTLEGRRRRETLKWALHNNIPDFKIAYLNGNWKRTHPLMLICQRWNSAVLKKSYNYNIGIGIGNWNISPSRAQTINLVFTSRTAARQKLNYHHYCS